MTDDLLQAAVANAEARTRERENRRELWALLRFLECRECGAAFKNLEDHLRRTHHMDRFTYIKKFGLPAGSELRSGKHRQQLVEFTRRRRRAKTFREAFARRDEIVLNLDGEGVTSHRPDTTDAPRRRFRAGRSEVQGPCRTPTSRAPERDQP